jgi:hypothetical protein
MLKVLRCRRCIRHAQGLLSCSSLKCLVLEEPTFFARSSLMKKKAAPPQQSDPWLEELASPEDLAEEALRGLQAAEEDMLEILRLLRGPVDGTDVRRGSPGKIVPFGRRRR